MVVVVVVVVVVVLVVVVVAVVVVDYSTMARVAEIKQCKQTGIKGELEPKNGTLLVCSRNEK